MEKFSTLSDERNAGRIVQTAYSNFLKELLRTYARDEIQRLSGIEIKDKITPVGEAISRCVLELTKDTPFRVTSVVVGNIQYPDEVANAVSTKTAVTQVLERMQIEIAIEERGKQKRIVQAEGIARSMEIISTGLTAQYLQDEAIEAQRAMVDSPNHTTIYIPVGPMGVLLVGTFDTLRQSRPVPEAAPPAR